MNKTRFKIGDWVDIKGRKKEGDLKNFPQLRLSEENITGQICGVTYRKQGSTDWSYDQPPYFYESGKPIAVWLIRDGMTNKPYDALDEDVFLCVPSLESRELPWRCQRNWKGEKR